MIKYKTLPIYGKIIYITTVVYILTQLWKLSALLFCWSGYDWQQWLALPANLNSLAMHPWTLLTYMFCHADLSQDPFHIIFNMLWLWCFGHFFVQHHSSRQLVTFYITSGVFAGLFYLLCYNIFPYFNLDKYFVSLVGASGALFALIVAVAMNRPNETIGLNLFVKVVWLKMKWLAVIVLLVNLLCLNVGNDGGFVCHIGGAIFGLLFGYYERRGIDITRWISKAYDQIISTTKSLGSKPKMKATRGGHREPISADKKRDMDYNAERRNDEEQINAILDKISKHGYDGLTAEEKQKLFDASRRRKKG